MAESTKKLTERLKESKDEMKKTPDIKVQNVKSLKEPIDSAERLKSRISRNVAINRSFNTNMKLELLK